MKRKAPKWVAVLLVVALIIFPVDPVIAQSTGKNVGSGELDLIQNGAVVGTSNEVKSSSQSINSLSENSIEQVLFDGLMNMDSHIDVSSFNLNVSSFKTLLQDFLNNRPEFFYLSSSFSYSYSDSGYLTTYIPSYEYSKEDVISMREELNSSIEQAMSGIDESWSDMEKALYIHDYIVSECSYDLTYSHYDAYSLLVNKSAVCQGYALAFLLFMNKLDIPCETVPSDSMMHIWNEIKLDGNWYHLDLTYDDPTNGTDWLARHDFFLLSDSQISSYSRFGKNYHHNYDATYACTDTTYDATDCFLRKSISPFVYSDGTWFYMDNTESGGVYTWNPVTSEKQIIVDMKDDKWSAGSYSWYKEKYSSLASRDGIIYYNTPNKIMSFPVGSTNDVSEVFSTTGSNSIFSIRIINDELQYKSGSAPSSITTTGTAQIFDAAADPEVTPEPEVTTEPFETEEPEVTSEPVASTEPEVTEEPMITANPEVTPEPEVTEMPTTTTKPQATQEPENTQETEITVPPDQTEVPIVTANPVVTEQPVISPDDDNDSDIADDEEEDDEEEDDSLLPTATPTSTSSSKTQTTIATSTPSVSSSDNETLDEDEDDSDSSNSSTRITNIYSNIKISAKRGKLSFTVKTTKKAKVVISLNKKYIKNKKKRVKKLTIAAKKNKSGIVKVKLSSKLKKKMVITVVVTYAGKTVKKKKTV